MTGILPRFPRRCTGDSGLWAAVDRGGAGSGGSGASNDGHIILSVQNGKLRFPWRDSYSNAVTAHLLSGVPLANDVTYRLTVRQFGTAFQVYLDGGDYSNSSPVYTGTQAGTVSFPAPNTGATSSVGRQMTVGNRSVYFGGTLKSGEWVDNIRVFNGYYTPDEIGEIPEPASLLLLAVGGVVMLRRSRGR